MPLHVVTDPDDPQLDDFRDLSDADVRPDRRGIVIAEGVNVVERLLSSPYRVRTVVGVPARLEALDSSLARLEAPVLSVDKWVLSQAVGFRVTRGVMASADRPAPLDPDDLIAASSRLAILESLNDFENLGSLFRNAAAFGVDGVLLDVQCADPLYRRSVRVSMGHVLRVPFAVLPGAWPGALERVRAGGHQLVALTPRGERDLRTVEPPGRWALLLGAEGPGLTADTLAAADLRVRIPMASGVDSLNVATAAAVAFAQLC